MSLTSEQGPEVELVRGWEEEGGMAPQVHCGVSSGRGQVWTCVTLMKESSGLLQLPQPYHRLGGLTDRFYLLTGWKLAVQGQGVSRVRFLRPLSWACHGRLLPVSSHGRPLLKPVPNLLFFIKTPSCWMRAHPCDLMLT